MRNPLRYRLWWTTRQKIVTSVVVAALLASTGWFSVDRLTAPEDRSCVVGVARPQGSDECVGVSGTGYDFGQSQLTSVAAAIGRQNSTLKAGRYATVALLLPLTSTDASMRTKVLHELQGAFVAQYRANNESDRVPKIRVVLANTGSNGRLWRPVVDRLLTMTGAPDQLRAVSGVAISSTQAKAAVKELTGAGIPVVGSTITADGFANGPSGDPFPGLARVSPTNRDEADALTSLPGMRADKALLVEDRRGGDPYTDTLKSAFRGSLKDPKWESQLFTSLEDPNDEGSMSNDFERITGIICDTDADTILFAGRHIQLRQFVNELGKRGCTTDPVSKKVRRFTVLTGDEGSYLGSDKKFEWKTLRHGVTVRYASLAHPDAWPEVPAGKKESTGGSAQDYRAFTDALAKAKKTVGPIGPTAREDLTDGQVIIAHDAMTLAVEGIRRATRKTLLPDLELVSKQWLYVKGEEGRVRGASGWICLDNHGNPYNKAVPIVQLAPDPPHQRFSSLAWPKGEAPKEDCVPPPSTR